MNTPAGIPDEVVQAQLQKILLSRGFVHSERLCRFLRFAVQHSRSGTPENLREYNIGVEVFDRPPSYNPAADPIVRVEARRLRRKLEEYYESEGLLDPLIIDVPKGSYIASFLKREEAPPPHSNHLRLALMAAAITLAAIALWWLPHRQPPPPNLALSRVTSDPGLTMDAAISSDGSLIAYASDRGTNGNLDIWIQQAAGGQPIPLTRDPADDHQPSFSRDGTRIAFRSERDPAGVYAIPALGGATQLIARDGRDPRFSPDGKWIAYWIGSPGDDFLPASGEVYIAPSTGGAPKKLAPDFATAAFPAWSPEGGRILFEGSRDPKRAFDWWVVDVNSGAATKTDLFNLVRRGATWVPDRLVFAATRGDSTNLWQMSFPGAKLQRLTQGTGLEVAPSVAADGTIVFSSLTETDDIWELAPDGSTKRVTESAAKSVFPSVSADGSRIAYLSNKGRSNAIYIKDAKTGQEIALPEANARYPRISRDGNRVAFSDGQALLIAPASGGQAKPVCPDCGRAWDWSPDNSRLLYTSSSTPATIGELTISTGAKRELFRDPQFDLAGPQFSPDGKWVSFHTIRGPNRRQIVVAHYPPEGPWIPVTRGTEMDRNATWSPDGDTLYFLSERDGFRCIWGQHWGTPTGPPFAVAHFHSAAHSLLPLGDVGSIGLAAAPGKLIFSLCETKGNTWIARPEAKP